MEACLRVSPIWLVLCFACGWGAVSPRVQGQAVDGDSSFLSARSLTLLAELRCAQCHTQLSSDQLGVDALKPIDLSEGSHQWGRESFADALGLAHARPGRGPVLYADWGKDERDGAASALWAFVRSENPSVSKPESIPRSDESAREGEILFRQIGCTVCHSPASTEEVDGSTEQTSFSKWRNKFSYAGMIRFLSGRHSGHAQRTGYEIRLDGHEAAAISRFLKLESDEEQGAVSRPLSAAIERGKKLFQLQRCDACHSVGEYAVARRSKQPLVSGPLRFGEDFGCLSPLSEPGVPSYVLTDEQRRQLRVAIHAVHAARAWNPEQILRVELERMRCLECHPRANLGGPNRDTLTSFESTEVDLGDEGRVPPDLSGVGRKMKQAALVQVIGEGQKARPYMLTRMPAYGRATAERLARLFALVDIPENEVPTVRETAENQVGRNMWGRALMGTTGLGCITCHALDGKRALGTSAIDLALAPTRLRPEWFRDYLLDPAHFRPGTRMPAFWPGGKPSLGGYGGSASRQIDSLWAYLAELDQSRLPVGLIDQQELMLYPGEEPMVFRTFMAGVGTHAIAVGFQAGPHAAFDALGMRWAFVWEGDFLDAESTWDNRFTPPVKPSGGPVVKLQRAVPEWGEPPQFLGYVRRGAAAPLFRYRVGSNVFEDSVQPRGEGASGVLRNLVRREGELPMWVDLASGEAVSRGSNGWQFKGGLEVRCEAELRAVKDGNWERLQARLPGGSVPAKLEVEYYW